MPDNRKKSSPVEEEKGSIWDWVLPAIIAYITMKLFGVLGGIVTLVAYYWLKPKLGIFGAVVSSGAIGLVVGAALYFFIIQGV